MKKFRLIIIAIIIVILSSTISCSASVEKIPKGILTIGASEEPPCADILGSCSISPSVVWDYKVHTIPSLFELGPNSEYVPTNVLVGVPKEENINGKFSVLYDIDPKAQWDDKTPISSKDIVYTWKEIMTGKDIIDTTGYSEIENIEPISEKQFRIIFNRSLPSYRELFSAYFGVLPAHILEGKDRQKILENGYKFSGGPYKMKTWKRGESLTFVVNPNWWGVKPQVKEFTYKFIQDEKSHINLIENGDLAASYLASGTNYDVPKSVNEIVGKDLQFESLTFNAQSDALKDVNVRKALALSVDREELSKSVLGTVDVENTIVPLNKSYQEYSQYSYDVDKAQYLMKKAGYKLKDNNWYKDGKKLTLRYSTTSGDSTRDNETVILLRGWKAAGFDIKVLNKQPDVLFDEIMPNGDFDIVLSAVYHTADIGLCALFCSSNYPPEGGNFYRYSTPDLDRLLVDGETITDVNKRKQVIQQAAEYIANDVPILPLFVPNVALVYSKNISNVIYNDPISGPWAKIAEWKI